MEKQFMIPEDGKKASKCHMDKLPVQMLLQVLVSFRMSGLSEFSSWSNTVSDIYKVKPWEHFSS